MRRREQFPQNLSEKVFYCLLLLHSTSNNICQRWQLVRRARQPLFSHFPQFNLVDQISNFLHPLLTLNTSDLLFWQWPCMIFDQHFGTDFVEKCVSGHWQWQVWVWERRSLKKRGGAPFSHSCKVGSSRLYTRRSIEKSNNITSTQISQHPNPQTQCSNISLFGISQRWLSGSVSIQKKQKGSEGLAQTNTDRIWLRRVCHVWTVYWQQTSVLCRQKVHNLVPDFPL